MRTKAGNVTKNKIKIIMLFWYEWMIWNLLRHTGSGILKKKLFDIHGRERWKHRQFYLIN